MPGICKGEVIEFQLRSTLIRAADCSIIHLPNGKLFRHPVVNFSVNVEDDQSGQKQLKSLFHLKAKLPQNTGSVLIRNIPNELTLRLNEKPLPQSLEDFSGGPAFVFVDDAFVSCIMPVNTGREFYAYGPRPSRLDRCVS